MKNNKKWNWEESSYEKFKNLSAQDVLEWMEEANRFFRKFLKPEEILRWRELKLLQISTLNAKIMPPC